MTCIYKNTLEYGKNFVLRKIFGKKNFFSKRGSKAKILYLKKFWEKKLFVIVKIAQASLADHGSENRTASRVSVAELAASEVSVGLICRRYFTNLPKIFPGNLRTRFL